jgi:hypothetical protein
MAKVLEAIQRQLGVTHRVLDVLVAEQHPRVVARVGQSIAAPVPQHVRMHRNGLSPDPTRQLCAGRGPPIMTDKAGVLAINSGRNPDAPIHRSRGPITTSAPQGTPGMGQAQQKPRAVLIVEDEADLRSLFGFAA